MSRYKRKIEDFDPNHSDSDDLDYGQNQSSPQRPQRPKSRKPKGPPAKKRAKRQRYGDSEEDIEIDSAASSDAEESYPEEVEEVERNPRTGRGVRSVAKKAVKYEEPSEDDIESAGSPDSSASPAKRSRREPSPPQQLIVTLKVPKWFAKMPPVDEQTTGARSTRSRTGSKSTNMRASTPNIPSGLGTRRSSRISHTDETPLQSLPTSGNRGLRSRRGTATPEPDPNANKRPTRGGKALPNMPSAILEESQEFSQEVSQPHGQAQLISQLQIAAGQDGGEATPGYTSVEAQEDEEIQMEQVVEESQEDEDDAPVARTNTRLRARRQASTPAPAQETSSRPRRGLKPKSKPEGEVSDFEPDAEGEDEADVAISSGDDSMRQTQSDSRTRRSGRNKGKTGSKSRRQSSESEAALDSDEIADEAADLEDDEKRKKRENRRKKPSGEITYEARKQLRARKEKVDYRMKTLAEVNNNDDLALEDAGDYQLLGSQQAAAPKARKPRADKEGYRSLFSTTGPFGGFSGPKPVLGGPSKHEMAGGADSDSSDDERAMAGMGGAAGMTPIKPMQPQSALTGPGGGPPDLGRVKDKQALADADPLGVDPNINFDSVGGLGGHIERLKEMCMLPLLYPEIYSRFHVTPPRGVLFHGPPGTGKTMLARALASSVGSHGKKVTFYVRKGADALSKWVGEAEKQLRLLFEEARKNQPSIIFFDEIDGLAPVRSSKQDQIHASIVSTLLALMDGMDGRGQVIVIGATNRPDSVDPALRRPGRFDREFYFPLPNQEARRAILDIHTKGWNPPLADEFKDKLAEQTKGYGGADIRALCTEAALNAVQGTFPQIYASDKKLIIDPSQIKVLAKDFMLSVDKIVPSSERSAASGAVPLKKDIEPLLRKPLQEITAAIDKAIPRKRKATALEEAMYDDRDDEYGFERENMQRQFESSRIFRPRLLIRGLQGMGQNYLGGAVLSKLEGLHVQNMGLSVLMSDTTRSPEAAIIQLFEEVKRHKPSTIYIPDVETWYHTLSESAIKTFTGLLRGIQPSEPVLLLGYMELQNEAHKPDPDMLRDLFGYSLKNQYELSRPDEDERHEFFQQIIGMVRKSPKEFPDPAQRKRRKLIDLPVAPTPPPVPVELTQAQIKAQRRKDRQTLNKLKTSIQPIMDQMRKYRMFVHSVIDDSVIRYLYDETDPKVLSSDLSEEQREHEALFRPYEIDVDEKGVQGLRETATGKFYYNLNTTVIEQRLSNGYYKRPKDFLADVKKLAKDARTMDNTQRTLKANELLTNVDVDIAGVEELQYALVAECDALYEREQARERERERKVEEAKQRGEQVPIIKPNVPPQHTSHSTTDGSGPIVLGQEIPGVRSLFPVTPSRLPGPSPISNDWSNTNGTSNQTNGSAVQSKLQDDSEMYDVSPNEFARPSGYSQQNTQGQRSQKSAHTQLAHGSQLNEYQNSASTTTSGQKTSDRSNRSSGPYSHNTQLSNGVHYGGDHPNFSALEPTSGGSQLPDTQEPHFPSSLDPASQSSQNAMGPPPTHRASIHNLLNDTDAPPEEPAPTLVIEEKFVERLHNELIKRSSGLSVEQLEQVNASIMEAIYETRGVWNRNVVIKAVSDAFNECVGDIEACQRVLKASQEED